MNVNNFLEEAVNADVTYPNALTRSELYQIAHNTDHAVPAVLCASLVTQKNIPDMRVGFKPVIKESQFSGKSRLLFLSKEDAQKFLDLCKGNPELHHIDAFEVKKARTENVLVRIDNNFDFPIYCDKDYVKYIFDKAPDRFEGMLLTSTIKSVDQPEKDSDLEQRIEKRQAKEAAIAHADELVFQELQSLFKNNAVSIRAQSDTYKSIVMFFSANRNNYLAIRWVNTGKEFCFKNDFEWNIVVELPAPIKNRLIIKDYENLFFTYQDDFAYRISTHNEKYRYPCSKEYKKIIRSVNENSSDEELKKACLKLHDYLLTVFFDIKTRIDNMFEEVEL